MFMALAVPHAGLLSSRTRMFLFGAISSRIVRSKSLKKTVKIKPHDLLAPFIGRC